MPKSKQVSVLQPRQGYGGSYGRSYGATKPVPNVASWYPSRAGSNTRWSEGQNSSQRAGTPRAGTPSNQEYSAYQGGAGWRRESSPSREVRASAPEHERWPSSAPTGPPRASSRGPRDRQPREAWAEPQEVPMESLPPGPPEPDPLAYEEAMDGIAQDIQDLQAQFREVQSRIHEQKEFTKKKAELRSELDTAADRLSQLQEHKERLMRSGIAWEEQQEIVQRPEENEPPDDESQRLAEIDEEIDVLQDHMWSRRLPLAEEKRILSDIAELYRQKSALKAREREREAKRAEAQDKVLLLRQQVDQVNEEIRALKSQKKAITQEYQELMEWRKQEANNMTTCLKKQEAISRKLQEKQQDRTRIDIAFKREEQRYNRWLASVRSSAAARAPSPGVPISLYDSIGNEPQQRSQARAHSRPPLPPGSPSAPSRRERPLSPRQRAGRPPPRDQREDSPRPAREEADQFGEVERIERELNKEEDFLQSELESKKLMLKQLDFAIKFCNDLLKRKPPKPQAPPPNPEHARKIDSTFEKCQRVPPKETRLQPGKDFLNEWHSSTTAKKSYQRARQIKQQQVNARSRSVEARLKQPPDLQRADFDSRRPAPAVKLDEKNQNRVERGWVKKTFGGVCLVRHVLADLPWARSPFCSWKVLEQLDLPVPGTIEDVVPVAEQAESMRGDVELRIEELEKSIESLTKEKSKLDRKKKSREHSVLEQESLDKVAEATEALAQVLAEAMEQGFEAVSRLVRAPWRDRRARGTFGRRPGAVDGGRPAADERARRREEKMPTALETLKDALAGARSRGISDMRLAEALDLEARVERRANEALLELAVDGLRAAREAEGEQNQRERRLAAKADLRHAIQQAESAGVSEEILELTREIVTGKARPKRKPAPEPAEPASEGASDQFVDLPSEEDASGQGFW